MKTDEDNEATMAGYEKLTKAQKDTLRKFTDDINRTGVGLADKLFDDVKAGVREKVTALIASPEVAALGSRTLADVDGECDGVALVCMHALTLALYRRFYALNPLAAGMSMHVAFELAATIRTSGEVVEATADGLAVGGLFRQTGRPDRS